MAEVELDTGFFGTSVTPAEQGAEAAEESYVATRAGALVDSTDTSAPDDTVVHGVFDGVTDEVSTQGAVADEVPPPPPPPAAALVETVTEDPQDVPPPPPAADDAVFGLSPAPVDEQAFGAITPEPIPVHDDAFEVDVDAIMADVQAIVADVALVDPAVDVDAVDPAESEPELATDEDEPQAEAGTSELAEVVADEVVDEPQAEVAADEVVDEAQVELVDEPQAEVEVVDDVPQADGQAVWEGATDEPTVWETPATETPGDGDGGQTWSGGTGDAEAAWAGATDAADADENETGSTDGADATETVADVVEMPLAPVSTTPATEPSAELARIMDGRLVTMMYQPITSLLDDSVVGYEALARGPEGSPLATPAAMFEAAEQAGRLKELDLLCQDQAVVQARDVLLKSGHALFVNVEASVLCDAAFGRDADAAAAFAALLGNTTAACPVVLEISDRYDFHSPAELLGVTMWARAHGFRVAIDDVGVQPKSLAILPLLEPDVIKLERGITSATPDADLGQLLSVVRSQSERTGAAVICQGIETAEEREIALSFGATHVQGYAIGYPEELSDAPLRIRSLEPVGASWGEPCSTPFELVANSSALRTGTEDLILALTLDLERQAAENVDAVVLSSFEKTVNAPGAIASRYQHLAEELDFVVALGEDLGEMKDVFTGDVDPGDPLEAERAVVILTPQFSAALLARVAGGEEGNREYAYALIYDRGQVTRAARMLIAHVEL